MTDTQETLEQVLQNLRHIQLIMKQRFEAICAAHSFITNYCTVSETHKELYDATIKQLEDLLEWRCK